MAKGQMYPDAIAAGMDNANWTLTGAGTKQAAIDDPVGAHNGDTDYIQSATSSSVIGFDLGTPPSMESVNRVDVVLSYALLQGSLSPRLRTGFRLGGVNYWQVGWIASSVSQYWTGAVSFPTNPATSAPWTETELLAAILLLESDNNNGTSVTRVTQALAEPDYVATPFNLDPARRRASVRLLIRRAVADGQYRGRF